MNLKMRTRMVEMVEHIAEQSHVPPLVYGGRLHELLGWTLAEYARWFQLGLLPGEPSPCSMDALCEKVYMGLLVGRTEMTSPEAFTDDGKRVLAENMQVRVIDGMGDLNVLTAALSVALDRGLTHIYEFTYQRAYPWGRGFSIRGGAPR